MLDQANFSRRYSNFKEDAKALGTTTYVTMLNYSTLDVKIQYF